MHYAIHELDQYRCRAMNFFRRLMCRCHLLLCRQCREKLLQLAQDDLLLAELRQSERQMKIPENQFEYHKLCERFNDERIKLESSI